jgi:phage terminase small subunit
LIARLPKATHKKLDRELTPQQERFVQHYVCSEDQNGAEAARRAGFAVGSAKVTACALLQRPIIRQRIKEETAKRLKRLEVTTDKIIAELSKLAFANMDDFSVMGEDGYARLDFSRVDRDKTAAIQELTIDEYTVKETSEEGVIYRPVRKTKFKLGDKKGALEILAKYKKMLTDKHEHSGPDGAPLPVPVIQIEFVDPPKEEIKNHDKQS